MYDPRMTKPKDNLRRGNIVGKPAELIPQPHGGALRPAYPPGNPDNFAKSRQREKDTRQRVEDNPDAALDEIHKDLTVLTQKIMRKAARQGEVPPRATMDVIREFRQTQEAVNEARKARGAVAQAEEFFASLDARVEEIATRLEDGPKPAVTAPA